METLQELEMHYVRKRLNLKVFLPQLQGLQRWKAICNAEPKRLIAKQRPSLSSGRPVKIIIP